MPDDFRRHDPEFELGFKLKKFIEPVVFLSDFLCFKKFALEFLHFTGEFFIGFPQTVKMEKGEKHFPCFFDSGMGRADQGMEKVHDVLLERKIHFVAADNKKNDAQHND